MKISVIIPVFNEEKHIIGCLESLSKQTYKDFEMIIVDDGSTDKTYQVLSEFQISNFKFQIFYQAHQGPAIARNLGAKYAKGQILVFVDADMYFDKNFLSELVKPIRKGKTIGTFSKEELLANKDNIWSLCWNLNRYLINYWSLHSRQYLNRILPTFYPDTQEVFRAIRKDEFNKVDGFDSIGYTDDWTLTKKIGKKALATNAVYFHNNPDTLRSVFNKARWIGKNEFLSGSLLRRIYNLTRYNLIFSFIYGFYYSVKERIPAFFLFKIVYDLGIYFSLITSFWSSDKY